MSNKADIKRDRQTNDVVVYDENGKEVFRKPYSQQVLSIANSIYMYHRHHQEHEKVCKIKGEQPY